MAYSETELEALRDRWSCELLKPGSFARDKNGKVQGGGLSKDGIDGCLYFDKLLSLRFIQIKLVLHPQIERIDKSYHWGNKRMEYQAAWKKPGKDSESADDIFQRTIKDLYDYGLEDYYPELSGFEMHPPERKIPLDLRGAYCEEAHFDGADCRGAHFDGAICGEAHFEGADCRGAHFDGAYCMGAHFDGADCSEAHFDGANCIETHFEGADCGLAHFKNECVLFNASFEFATCNTTWFDNSKCQFTKFINSDCQRAQFKSTNLMGADFTNAKLNHSYIKDAEIDTVTKFDTIIREERELCEGDTLSMVETYNQLKQLQKNHGYYGRAGDFYFREMHCRRMALPKTETGKRIWMWIGEKTIGYGEKPESMAKGIGLAILIFSGIFSATGIQCTNNGAVFYYWPKALYLSVVTFATLGYGDFSPYGTWGKIAACVEALLGLLFVGLFVVSMARKIIRD